MKKILLILCFLSQNLGVFAAKTDTLKISDGETRYLTRQYFLELEDPDNNILAKDIINKDGFHPISASFPRLKYSKSVTWLKFIIKNNSNDTYIPLTISKSIIDEFDIYFIEKINYNGQKSTRLRHLSSKEAQYNANMLTQSITLVNVPLARDSSMTIFARIKSNASTIIPIEVNSANQFIQKRSVENVINGGIIGMFIIMALYNLMLFVIVGDKNYLYYVIYIVFLGSTQSLILGIGSNLFPDNTQLLNDYITPILRICFGFSLLLFAGSFLQFKQNIKPYYKFYQLLYILYTLPLIAALYGFTHLAYTLITLATLLTSTGLLVLVTILYSRGFNPAKFFILGWGLFLISILVSIARNNGLVPYNYFTLNIVIYSALIELILFSVALADKINFYRSQNTESQLAALAIAKENERLITEQNIFLENKVKDRTQELIQTNQNLSVTIDNLKSAQIQLVETEKMASLGLLTAGVAHEINNPINFVGANVKPLRVDFDEIFSLLGKYEKAANSIDRPELLNAANKYRSEINVEFVKNEIHTLLDGIEEGAARTAEIVQSLRTFSRMDELALVPANINTAILSTLVILRSAIPYYIEVKPILNKLEPLNCYSGKINQALLNLINNSIQAIAAKKVHKDENITIYTHDYPDHITIEIIDTGIGMSDEVKQRIFEPFFTTKNIGEGTGLGLSIVFGIIEKHNGSIHVQSKPDVGSKFTIMLPKNLEDAGDDHT
ncbi:7TM diverse intracellular signaling domain-containing protein [Mucilaginibacter sp. UR6-11]|uniref:sensor histidine kinase n=1 Tax=Mucilaginibacter sp. UR6-11 TaxID=1435644 RepID=UPI001E289E66|nr:7TM diverse intracellular signaling domain-containing protein [Mucilaginibacter sp. UR6-11]MCC8423442.1 sensor histidine kinase [Mucilaginibacter sp. UR6-11]